MLRKSSTPYFACGGWVAKWEVERSRGRQAISLSCEHGGEDSRTFCRRRFWTRTWAEKTWNAANASDFRWSYRSTIDWIGRRKSRIFWMWIFLMWKWWSWWWTICSHPFGVHKIGSLYEKFPPEQARAYVKRLEIHQTPKHGSWLDTAEIELSILTKQCLKRRIGDIETYRREVNVWQDTRNNSGKGVDWQFTTNDARIKLKKMYPHS